MENANQQAAGFMSKDFRDWTMGENVRIGTILVIGVAHDGKSPVPPLDDLIDESSDEELGELFGRPGLAAYLKSLNELRDDDENDRMDRQERQENILQFLAERSVNGVLIYAERAYRNYTPGGKGYQFSFGFCATKRFYGESLDACVPLIRSWADAFTELEKKNPGKWGYEISRKKKKRAKAKGGK